MLEIYQLFLFSTLGVIFYTPVGDAQIRIVAILRIVYIAAWALLAGVMIFFAIARRSARIRNWVENGRAGALLATFMQARPLDYLAVLSIKAPTFLASVVAQYYALALYGIAIPFVKLMLFLPLVFLAAALPISVAHLGTSQAAWLLFFSSNATPAKIVAYSLAAQLTFMLCNALIGLVFLPRASRELTALRAGTREHSCDCVRVLSTPSTGKPSRRAASASLPSSVTSSRDCGSPSAATIAAPSWSASAVRSG